MFACFLRSMLSSMNMNKPPSLVHARLRFFVIVFMQSIGEAPMGEAHELTQKIKRKAIELGFACVGVTAERDSYRNG